MAGCQHKRRGRNRLVMDDHLEPAERLLIAIFQQARIDIFSTQAHVREAAEGFMATCGYDVQEIRAAWVKKRKA